MNRFFLALTVCLALAPMAFVGCASSKEEDPTREDREKVSTIPWNRPANWEGKGGLGGFVQ